MSESKTTSDSRNATVLHMDDRRRGAKSRDALPEPVRIKVEVACHDVTGQTIKAVIGSKLESHGCILVESDKPDWVLSIIAFSHGDTVEMSIILRRLFRSTAPSTEVEQVDEERRVGLRQGGWLYESLRFHGLFGVPTADLDCFFERLVKDFANENWKQPSSTSVSHKRRPYNSSQPDRGAI
jgi:hypothetical protein